MIETLVVAIGSGLVAGALLLGALCAQVKTMKAAIHAMHARFDTLVIALAKNGMIDAGAVAHLARAVPR